MCATSQKNVRYITKIASVSGGFFNYSELREGSEPPTCSLRKSRSSQLS